MKTKNNLTTVRHLTTKPPRSKFSDELFIFSSQGSKRGVQSRQAPPVPSNQANPAGSQADEIAFLARDKIPRTPYKKQ